eukprot:UN34599
MVILRDENAPERTKSAYVFFCDKNRSKVAKNNPDFSFAEIGALLGKMWTETSDKTRTPFVNQASKSKAKFDKEMETYRQTPEYIDFQKKRTIHMLIQKYVEKIPGAKRKMCYKVFPADPNKPKQPFSSFLLFSNDKRESMMKKNDDASLQEIGKLLGEAWKNSSASIKAKYTKQHKKLKEKYDIDVEKYQNTKNVP